MGPFEIILLIIGGILVCATFVFSEKFSGSDKEIQEEISKNAEKIASEIIRKEVEVQLAVLIDDKIEETKISLGKIVNENMMSLGEYSQEINNNIEKNHNEVMFLYNMLNDKEKVLKDTIRDIEALKLSVKKMAIVNDVAKSEINNIDRPVEKEIKKTESNINKEVEKEKTLRTHNPTTVNNNALILKLYREGKNNMEIAKELGLGMGEVRLVIDLFKKES